MCEWIKIVAHSVASRIGFREPEAKGAIVSGIRAADANLSPLVNGQVTTYGVRMPPFKGPMIASVSRGWLRNVCRIVHYSTVNIQYLKPRLYLKRTCTLNGLWDLALAITLPTAQRLLTRLWRKNGLVTGSVERRHPCWHRASSGQTAWKESGPKCYGCR